MEVPKQAIQQTEKRRVIGKVSNQMRAFGSKLQRVQSSVCMFRLPASRIPMNNMSQRLRSRGSFTTVHTITQWKGRVLFYSHGNNIEYVSIMCLDHGVTKDRQSYHDGRSRFSSVELWSREWPKGLHWDTKSPIQGSGEQIAPWIHVLRYLSNGLHHEIDGWTPSSVVKGWDVMVLKLDKNPTIQVF